MQRRKVLLAGFCASATFVAHAQEPAFFLVAFSPDHAWQLWADTALRLLEVRHASGAVKRSYPWPTLAQGLGDGTLHSPLLARLYLQRRSFVIGFGGCSELWEISVDPDAEPIWDGLVHDYRNKEAISRPGYLGVRRTVLDEPLDDWYMDGQSPYAMGQSLDGKAQVLVIHLDIRRKIGSFNSRAEALAALPRASFRNPPPD